MTRRRSVGVCPHLRFAPTICCYKMGINGMLRGAVSKPCGKPENGGRFGQAYGEAYGGRRRPVLARPAMTRPKRRAGAGANDVMLENVAPTTPNVQRPTSSRGKNLTRPASIRRCCPNNNPPGLVSSADRRRPYLVGLFRLSLARRRMPYAVCHTYVGHTEMSATLMSIRLRSSTDVPDSPRIRIALDCVFCSFLPSVACCVGCCPPMVPLLFPLRHTRPRATTEGRSILALFLSSASLYSFFSLFRRTTLHRGCSHFLLPCLYLALSPKMANNASSSASHLAQ